MLHVKLRLLGCVCLGSLIAVLVTSCGKESPKSTDSKSASPAAPQPHSATHKPNMSLHTAAQMGNLKEVRANLENGIDVNSRVSRVTAIHLAAREGYLPIVRFLLEHGADINAKGDNDFTPLHYAAKDGHKEIVDFLLEKNADVTAKDDRGWTPAAVAKAAGRTEIAEVLSQRLVAATPPPPRESTMPAKVKPPAPAEVPSDWEAHIVTDAPIQSFDIRSIINGQPEHAAISVAVAADGKSFVTGHSRDRDLVLWETAGLKRLWQVTWGVQSGDNKCVSMSPDQKWILAGTNKNFVTLVPSTGGKAKDLTLGTHAFAIDMCVFSRDGTKAATVSGDGIAKVWYLNSHRVVILKANITSAPCCIAFTPDNAHAMTASATSIRTWSLPGDTFSWTPAVGNEWTKEYAILEPERETPTEAKSFLHGAFSSDCRLLVTTTAVEPATLWDTEKGRPIAKLVGHDFITSVAFCDDDSTLMTVDKLAVRLWQLQKRKVFFIQRVKSNLTCAAIIPGQGQVLVADENGTGYVWNIAQAALAAAPTAADVADKAANGSEKSPHSDSVWPTAIALSPDGQTLATGSMDQTVKLWSVANGSVIRTLRGHTGTVGTITFSKDGKLLVSTGTQDKTARLWDTSSGALLKVFNHKDTVSCCALSADEKFVATASDDKIISVWALPTGERHGEVRVGARTESLACSYDGGLIASASGKVNIWKWNQAKPIATLEFTNLATTEKTPLLSRKLHASPDGLTFLAIPDRHESSVDLWDFATGTPRRVFSASDTKDINKDAYCCAAFSPDGKLIAVIFQETGQHSSMLVVWDAVDGSITRQVQLKGDLEHRILFIRIMKDGRLLGITEESTESVALWDCLETKRIQAFKLVLRTEK